MIIPLFFLWFSYLAFSQAPPDARKQAPMCILVPGIFFAVAFWAMVALVYIAVIFIGMYMGGVGAAMGGYGDSGSEGRVRRYISLIGVIAGIFIEISYRSLFAAMLPAVQEALGLSLASQNLPPSPSGYGPGYYISTVSILFSIFSTTRESAGLAGDITESNAPGGQGSMVGRMLNPFFRALSTTILWPLLPFYYLNQGFAILYILGWVTAGRL